MEIFLQLRIPPDGVIRLPRIICLPKDTPLEIALIECILPDVVGNVSAQDKITVIKRVPFAKRKYAALAHMGSKSAILQEVIRRASLPHAQCSFQDGRFQVIIPVGIQVEISPRWADLMGLPTLLQGSMYSKFGQTDTYFSYEPELIDISSDEEIGDNPFKFMQDLTKVFERWIENKSFKPQIPIEDLLAELGQHSTLISSEDWIVRVLKNLQEVKYLNSFGLKDLFLALRNHRSRPNNSHLR
jgi:hypothetical protein